MNNNDDPQAPRALDTATARAGALYSEIWTLLAASRFCLFFAVSFFIYQSKPDAWGVSDAGPASDAVPSGLDQLKNRVVFTYGFMEMIFWFWVCDLLSLQPLRFPVAFVSVLTFVYTADSLDPPRRAARNSDSNCLLAIAGKRKRAESCNLNRLLFRSHSFPPCFFLPRDIYMFLCAHKQNPGIWGGMDICV